MPTFSPQKTLNSTSNQQHFSHLVQMTLATLGTEGSKSTYRQTYNRWQRWCYTNQISPADLRPGYVLIFLTEEVTTKASREHHLLALRKLAKMDYTLHPTDDTCYTFTALQTIKVSPLPHFR